MTHSDGFDVLVLGGGSAGCVLAARLSEDPARRVCLVEAGPDYGPFAGGGWPADLLDGSLDATESHDWGYEGGLSSSRARVLGGCSAHNGCGIVWPTPADVDAWGVGWSFAGLRPFLERAQRVLRTRPTRLDRLERTRQAFYRAAVEHGFPAVADLNAAHVLEGVGGAFVNAVGNVRWNTSFAYLDPARTRPNLTILPQALVDRVEFRGARAVGARVLAASGARVLAADLVVLTAGAFASPAILQRSGIDHAAVGAGMANHPHVALLFEAGRPDAVAGEVGQALLKARVPGGAEDGWDLMLGAWAGPGPDALGRPTGPPIAGILASISKPRSTGSVRIRSLDPTVLPAIDHGFLTDPDGHDRSLLAAGAALARALARTTAWREVAGAELVPGIAVSDADLSVWAADSILGDYHPCGTCRMGERNDERAVVGPNGAVHGSDGLFVADASILPTVPRANIHLTVLGVAERIAELLSAR